MTIVQCSGCEKKLKVKDELVGKRVKCPVCDQVFVAQAAHPPSEVQARTRSSEKPPGGSQNKQIATSPPAPQNNRVRWWWYAAGGVATLCLVAGLVFILSKSGNTLPSVNSDLALGLKPKTEAQPKEKPENKPESEPEPKPEPKPKPEQDPKKENPVGKQPAEPKEVEKLPSAMPKLPPEWPLARGNPEGTGVVPHVGPRTQPVILWKFQSGGPRPKSALANMTCVPVVQSEIVYWGSDDGKLYALRLATGQKNWEHFLSDDKGQAEIRGAAVADNRVFVGGLLGGFVCLQAQTGKRAWRSDFRSGIFSVVGPPLVTNQKVLYGYMVLSGGGLACNDVDNKSIDYHIATPNSPVGTIGLVHSVPTTDGESIFFGSDNGMVVCHKIADGIRVWLSIPEEFAFVREAVALGQDLAFVCVNDTLVCLHKKNGKPKWKKTLQKGNPLHGPSVGKDFAIVTSEKGSIYCLSRDDGSVRWTQTQTGSSLPPIVGKDVVYFSAKHKLVALDLETGKSLWTLQMPAEVTSSPALAHGKLLVSAADGALYAVGLAGSASP